MSVLVACEESQAVTIELRRLGIEAYSCDVLSCSGGHPEWHIQGDVLPILNNGWEMIIAFPPCTHLAVSGARWFEGKRESGEQQAAIEFVKVIWAADCPRVAIENPVGILPTVWRDADYYIQPYEYGHPETKKTGIWSRGLPPLRPTHNVYAEMMTLPLKERSRIHYMPPGPNRAEERSKTYPGIARAIAEQWGGELLYPTYPLQMELAI